MTKKGHGDGAQHFACEHCGHDWRISPDTLPVAPHCPACGNPVQQVVDLMPVALAVAEPVDIATALYGDDPRFQPERAFTATGTACADCGAEEGHREVVDGVTGAMRRCAYSAYADAD